MVFSNVTNERRMITFRQKLACVRAVLNAARALGINPKKLLEKAAAGDEEAQIALQLALFEEGEVVAGFEWAMLLEILLPILLEWLMTYFNK